MTIPPIHDLEQKDCKSLVGVFCDIDDTLTHEGELVPDAFMALFRAREAGLRVIPITGRPGGWVDHIARMWPVDGVVGENGGLWFYMKNGSLQRSFLQPNQDRIVNREKLEKLAGHILSTVPGCKLASDQPYRELDLAIDFCEDVPPLGDNAIDAIVQCFTDAGAVAKVSSIHVNGWFGDFDKLTGCERLLDERYSETLASQKTQWVYFGDSANDEPMFEYFPHSIGVANVKHFLPRMKAWPSYITKGEGGMGFAEGIDHILRLRSS